MVTQYLTTQNLVLTQGDALPLRVTLRDETGAVINITGWTITARIGTRGTPALADATVTYPDAPGGVLLAEWTVAQTTPLIPNQQYSYNIRVDDGDGLVRTVVRGQITVLDSLFL